MLPENDPLLDEPPLDSDLDPVGYSWLAPRPRHEKQDLTAQKKFQEESAPLL